MNKQRYIRRDSGLLTPGEEIAIGVRDRFYPESRRYLSRRRCCCCPDGSCILVDATFGNAYNLADAWTQETGTWTISNNLLSSSNDGAVITSIVDHPCTDAFHRYVVSAHMNSSNGNRSRLIFSYDADASTYNFVEVYWNGAASHVYVKDSGGTTYLDLPVDLSSSSSFVVSICVSDSAVNVSTNGLTFYTGSGFLEVAGSCDISSSTSVCGLGCGIASGSVKFSQFYLSRHGAETPYCAKCYCGGCDTLDPQNEILVKLRNITDWVSPARPAPRCGSGICDALNSDYFLQRVASGHLSGSPGFLPTACVWQHTFASPLDCGDDWENWAIHDVYLGLELHVARHNPTLMLFFFGYTYSSPSTITRVGGDYFVELTDSVAFPGFTCSGFNDYRLYATSDGSCRQFGAPERSYALLTSQA